MDRRVLFAIVLIDRRLAAVDLPGLAAEVNLSPSQFSRVFGAATGLSPSQYIHALRMERARLLLERTFLSVKQAMAQVGITDASHFSRNFRTYHGMTPGEAKRLDPQPGPSPFLARHHAWMELAAARQAVGAERANE